MLTISCGFLYAKNVLSSLPIYSCLFTAVGYAIFEKINFEARVAKRLIVTMVAKGESKGSNGCISYNGGSTSSIGCNGLKDL